MRRRLAELGVVFNDNGHGTEWADMPGVAARHRALCGSLCELAGFTRHVLYDLGTAVFSRRVPQPGHPHFAGWWACACYTPHFGNVPPLCPAPHPCGGTDDEYTAVVRPPDLARCSHCLAVRPPAESGA